MTAPETRPDPRPEMLELADQCVKCGLCLPHCPTYFLDADEAESPRGRIALARGLADGTLAANAPVRRHLDQCLGCLSCQAACPSGVRYGELLLATRGLLGPAPGQATGPLRLLRSPRRLHWLRIAADLTRAWRWAPPLARRLLPARSRWRAAAQLLPPPAPRPAWRDIPAPHPPRGRVALFPGCVASVYDADALDAAGRLLHAAGYAVTRLPAICCGALDAHAGNSGAADRQAVAVRDALDASACDTLLGVSPGCLASLRAAVPGRRCDDALAFLAARADGLRFAPLPRRLALHIPCTQANVAHAGEAVRDLLKRIPGLDLQGLPAPPRCCGAAGSHVLDHPQRAARLRDATLDQAEALSPQGLVSGNIGCRLHLAAGWRGRGHATPVEHPLTLLARQLEMP